MARCLDAFPMPSSSKHLRSRAWDDRVLRGPLTPVKWLLRAGSSITLAVVIITLIAIFGVIGSVPVDLFVDHGPDAPRHLKLFMLPAFELTQSEFFALWPMQALLYALVANMIIATVRRIEFTLENLGVLTVHAGIVVLAIGSAIYGHHRREGVLVLPLTSGEPSPFITSWWDAWDTQIVITSADAPPRTIDLPRLPRYNDFNTPWQPRPLSVELRGNAGGAPLGTIDAFGAYAVLEEIAREVPTGSPGSVPAWAVRLVASSGDAASDAASDAEPAATLIDTGVVLLPLDAAAPPLSVPGVAIIRAAPQPGPAPSASVPTITLTADQCVIEQPGAPARTIDVQPGGRLTLGPGLQLTLERLVLAAVIERVPIAVAPEQRRPELVGTRRHAAIRVTLTGAPGRPVWLPLSLDADEPTAVTLDSGKVVRLSWRPIRHALPAALALESFVPITDDDGNFRDFHARVVIGGDTTEQSPQSSRVIALNRPLSLPMESRGVRALLAPRLTIAHASWDEDGWKSEGTPAFAIFTVGVAHASPLIALGGVLMVLGTPWAFYVKPWMRRRRARRATHQGAPEAA
jgi:hypothetical protein